MKSWEVLRNAADRVGVKALAARLNLSSALVYKWCQESTGEPGGSGALNPLDRLAEIYQVTRDPQLINWICNAAGGFYVKNPDVEPGLEDESLLDTTQHVVAEFAAMLSAISRSVENDGQIVKQEAEQIRRCWEQLKMTAECFVVACEHGLYRFPA